jgi:hypothetical protein
MVGEHSKRAYDYVSDARFVRTSIILTLSKEGFEATVPFKGTLNREGFEVYLRGYLVLT